MAEVYKLTGMKPMSDKISGNVKLPERPSELWTGKERIDYIVGLDGDCRIIPRTQQIYEIMPGVDRDGKYVLQTHIGYFFITKAQYDSIISLCRSLYETAYKH